MLLVISFSDFRFLLRLEITLRAAYERVCWAVFDDVAATINGMFGVRLAPFDCRELQQAQRLIRQVKRAAGRDSDDQGIDDDDDNNDEFDDEFDDFSDSGDDDDDDGIDGQRNKSKYAWTTSASFRVFDCIARFIHKYISFKSDSPMSASEQVKLGQMFNWEHVAIPAGLDVAENMTLFEFIGDICYNRIGEVEFTNIMNELKEFFRIPTEMTERLQQQASVNLSSIMKDKHKNDGKVAAPFFYGFLVINCNLSLRTLTCALG